MISNVFPYHKPPETGLTNLNSTKTKPALIAKQLNRDKVQLSAAGIQKSSAADEQVKKGRQRFESQAVIDPQQKENIENLIVDLKVIKESSEVTEEQKETLKNDLRSTIQGAQKPSEEAIEKLIADLSEILSDGHIDLNDLKTLQEDINMILNSANISDEQIEILKEDVQAIVESSNITKEDVETIWNDIIQILETAKN